MSPPPRREVPPEDGTPPDVRAVRALARLSRVLERADAELSLAHYRVLSAVAEGDQRATRLAARLALGKPTVSAAVDALSRRGLLLRGPVRGDQRAVVLSLTPRGRALLDRVEERMAARIAGLCARTPDGPGTLRALAVLGDALEQAHVERTAGHPPSGGRDGR